MSTLSVPESIATQQVGISKMGVYETPRCSVGEISASIVSKDNRQDREECFRLRYQAYCLERQWEPVSKDGMETDQYDGISEHILVRYRGQPVATARLILGHDLPFWNLADEYPPISREKTAEISRFAFPRSAHEIVDKNEDKMTIILHMCGGLLKAIKKHNVLHLVTLHSRAASCVFCRAGAYFNPVGSPVEYHGIRQPYWTHVHEQMRRWKEERPENYDQVMYAFESED